jgi:hypothetical protein
MHSKEKQAHNTNKDVQKPRWATFTYSDNDTRTITKLLKNTNVKVAYRTINTIKNHLKQRLPETDRYNLSGVYELKCNDCPLKYVGPVTKNTFTL